MSPDAASAGAEPYRTAADAVGAEVARLASRMRLMWARALAQSAHLAPSRGGDVDDELVRLELPAGRMSDVADDGITALAERHGTLERAVVDDRARSRIPIPLYRLRERAALDALAFDLFLVALAPEIDDGFGRVFIYMRGGGVGRRLVDVATASRLLTPRETGADSIRGALAPGGPLVRLGLVELHAPDGSRTTACTLGTLLSVPPPVVSYVLGHTVEDAALRLFVLASAPAEPRERAHLPDELWPRASALLDDPAALTLLEGPAGVGKRALLRTLCAEKGRDLVEVDVLRAPGGLSPDEALAILRVAWLREATILLGLPGEAEDEPQAWRRGLAEMLVRFPGSVALCRDTVGGTLDLPMTGHRRLSLLTLSLPEPTTRAALWRDALGDETTAGLDVDVDVDIDALARNYPITAGVIARVAQEARVLAAARRGAGSARTLRDLLDAIEGEFAPRLQVVGRKLKLKAGFADLVLAPETRETLAEMEATLRLRHQVLDDWKFSRLVRGRGVSALFYGDPGTGKTLSAGVIAAAVGLPLYQINTAQVISKWVGETEKKLAEVFQAAEAGHAMLLFDEADAIFGKRTEVQSSTDRYANMQTNFLLTQIELFNGVSVLTTNRESVMDLAFQRRLTFRVYFPMPEVEEREALWRQMLAGHDEDGSVDCKRLATRLRMSGGYIRNAVLRGAYLAAAAGTPITTEVLAQAAELVLRDAGKVI